MDVVKKRRSIRKFKADQLPDEFIDRILESARLAPSGSNRQPWHFIVVKERETIKRLGLPAWAAQAPVIIICAIDPEEGRWCILDGSIAMEHLILAATDLGLGTCWIGRILENLGETDVRIKKLLDIPEHMTVLAVTPVGYPDEEPKLRYVKTMNQIVHYERF